MAAHRLVFIHLAFLCSSISYSQGWQFVGPDSTNWQNVRRVSGKWTSPTSYKLASVAYGSIALFQSNDLWNYNLRGYEGTPFTPGRGFFSYDFSPWDDSVYIGDAYYYTEPSFAIFKSRFPNSGWSNELPGGCWITPLSVIFSPNDSIVFASMCGIHRSTNGGITWTLLQRGSGSYFGEVLAFDERSSRVVYKADGYGPIRFFRSANQGLTWDSLFVVSAYFPYHLNDSPLSAFAIGDTIVVGVKSSPGQPSPDMGMFRTSNGGQTWSRVYAGGNTVGIVKSLVTPNTLFAASEEGILESTDFGATWTMHNNALPTRRLTSLIISPYSDTMFVSTETHGVLKVWNFLTDVDESKTVPTQFVLHQNYPNPFNPTTTIRFVVGHRSSVCLKVFDLLGREVATLVNEEMQPGSYEKTFSGDGLVSGVYLYRLQAGSFTQSEKLLLLR